MKQYIRRALQKASSLTASQISDLLLYAGNEIDRLEIVLDSLPRGVLVCDTANKLILANKSARRFFSIVSYEQARETIWSVIPENEVSQFLANALLSNDSNEEEEFTVDVNGVYRLINITVTPLVQNHQITGSIILAEDITERRNRESRLRLMENLASLTTLAAGVAHEIKNPLGSISIHVQLVQKAVKAQEELCKQQKPADSECEPGKYFRQIDKYLNVLNEEVDRLNAIVVDFLFAVRPVNAEFRKGDFNAFIRDLAEFVSFELKEANVALVLNLGENLPALQFDASLMKQALLNLIKNAAAAMPSNGELTITTEAAGEEVLVSIADNGIGITGENLPKIFEPYFTTKEEGTGLGLTVTFKIIKEHRGEISVRSGKGEGTVFTIKLPMPQAERLLIGYDGDVPKGD